MTNGALNTMVERTNIEALADEAATAGDYEMQRICGEALTQGPGSEAWVECERVITEALAEVARDAERED